MGQVYLAHTPSGRKLVIKVIRPELAREDGFRARFAREADAARRVGGFHTAQVVDADPDADPPWIGTAHIPGPTLDQTVRDQGPLAPPALRVLATGLAEGLDAIHGCGLVHRDLKPANIILAEDGPRIIDFGVARPLDADSMTSQGAVFGTLPYMSPEQTDGSRVGPASDLFSLGTVLAYAATGTNPFAGATMAETVRRIISPPPDPGAIASDVRTLITDCWNHDPGRRPTPDQILSRFQDHDLHHAWPAAPASGVLGPATGTTAPLGGGEPSSDPPAPARSAVPETRVAPAPRRDEGDATRRTALLATGAVIVLIAIVGGLVSWNLAFGDGGSPEGDASSGESAAPSDEVTADEASGQASTVLDGHTASVNAVAFSPDGSTLASGGKDGTVRLWDTATGTETTSLDDHGDQVASVAFSPDGATLATGSWDDTVRLWDVETGEHLTTLDHTRAVRAVAFSSDGSTLASGGGYTVRLWDVGTGEETAVLEGHDFYVNSVAFSPDGSTLASGSDDDTARMWDIDTGEEIATLRGHGDEVASVAFSPDGAILASGGGDTVRLWDAGTGEHRTTLDYDHFVSSVAFSPDGAALAASGSIVLPVLLWNVATGEWATGPLDHDEAVVSVAISPDGATLAGGSTDGTVLLWDIS